MKKVICKLHGGLGNQLFIYAAGRSLAMQNNMQLVLDTKSGFLRDRIYKRTEKLHKFNINCIFLGGCKGSINLLTWKLLKFFKEFLNFKIYNYVVLKKACEDLSFSLIDPNKNIYLDGYFQREIYFIKYAEVIRNDLIFLVSISSDIKDIEEQIRLEKSVVVHFRCFSSIDADRKRDLDLEYYNQAIAIFSKKIENPIFYIFSDDIEVAKNKLQNLLINFEVLYINTGDEVRDLYLMSHASNYIISNSTFSWWGAWLSKSKYKTIINPGNNYLVDKSTWNHKQLIPNEWITVNG